MDRLTDVWLAVQPSLQLFALKAVGALFVLLTGVLLARIARGMTTRALERSPLDATLIPFLSGLLYFGVLAFAILASLHLLGIQVTAFIAVLGAAGLAIALAFQGTLSNLASGVMILTFRPFRVGDRVEIAGMAGDVTEVGVFSSVLTTPDNVRIVLPNTQIFGQVIKNYSANETRRIDLVVGVGYDDDLNTAVHVIRETIEGDPRVLADPAPVVAVSEMADSSVNLVVRPWVRAEDYWDARFALTKALKERIEEAGLSLPYPQRDLHHHGMAAPPKLSLGTPDGP